MTTKTAKKAAPKKAAKTPAKTKAATKAAPVAPTKASPAPRDPRLPAPGTTLTRTYEGKEIKAEVLDAGFKFDGKTWRSLSAIARTVSGTSWNGYLFFNLQTRATKAAAATTAEAK